MIHCVVAWAGTIPGFVGSGMLVTARSSVDDLGELRGREVGVLLMGWLVLLLP